MMSTVITALFGGGESRALTRFALPSQIISCLRRNSDSQDEISLENVITALQSENFLREAIFLANETHFESARKLVDDGKVITITCPEYPKVLFTSTKAEPPPIFWISDPMLRQVQPWNNKDGSPRPVLSAVGCRAPLSIGVSIANEAGLWAASQGYLSVSGGAAGCDTHFGNASFGAGGEVVHILPFGLNYLSKDQRGYGISVCPPNEPFSPGRAMERNSLIYALGTMTLVCSVRYRQGGTWQGASSALKAHRSVIVADWTSTGLASTIADQVNGTYGQAQRALANLGAHSIFLDIQTFRDQVPTELNKAVEWAGENGKANTGLFRT